MTQRALARQGGDRVKRPLPAPVSCHGSIAVVGGSAVYVVCTEWDEVLYVGSVHRPLDARGIARRLSEHMRDPLKRMHWGRLWLLPIKEDADLTWVRAYEGLVGTELAPGWNERLPRL